MKGVTNNYNDKIATFQIVDVKTQEVVSVRHFLRQDKVNEMPVKGLH